MIGISVIKTALSKRQTLSVYLEQHAQRLSKTIWPWSESRLLILVAVIAAMDYISTLAFLQFSGDCAFEAGLLASWALSVGGYLALLIVDVTAVGILILAATATQRICKTNGLSGPGHAVFVLLLTPYATIAAAAVCNNIVIALL